MTTKATKPTCPYCGGDNLQFEGRAIWNQASQSMEPANSAQYQARCIDCDDKPIDAVWGKADIFTGKIRITKISSGGDLIEEAIDVTASTPSEALSNIQSIASDDVCFLLNVSMADIKAMFELEDDKALKLPNSNLLNADSQPRLLPVYGTYTHIAVGPAVVGIKRDDEGVVVDVYSEDRSEVLASAHVTYVDAAQDVLRAMHEAYDKGAAA